MLHMSWLDLVIYFRVQTLGTIGHKYFRLHQQFSLYAEKQLNADTCRTNVIGAYYAALTAAAKFGQNLWCQVSLCDE